MKRQTFCYHITNGSTRSAVVCGTVTAETMEEAAKEAARRSKLVVRHNTEDIAGLPERYFTTESGERRNVYVLFDPQ